jgi:molybdate transport system substrate-binding protein
MTRRSVVLGALLTLGAACCGGGGVAAETATIAVAANFVKPLDELRRAFEARSGHELTVSSGSTGQLYAQIVNGAPYDVLLSADSEHPDRLIADGLADGAERFTYAIGKLALFTRDAQKFAPLDMHAVERTDYRWVAIANPSLAPYGLAAEQALRKLGLWETLQPRIVRGQSIAQTFAMAETRNADLALVALSQVIEYGGVGAHLEVPADLYEPLRQDAVLLKRARGNSAAREFLAFLRSADARRTIEKLGYGLP